MATYRIRVGETLGEFLDRIERDPINGDFIIIDAREYADKPLPEDELPPLVFKDWIDG